jgi:elongation factor G
VIDLIDMRALFFRGESGEEMSAEPIPADLLEAAGRAREEMLDAVSMFSDELTAQVLEGRATPESIRRAVREATLARQVVPVLLGSAYRNKGVQPLLDAVVNYLPAPDEVTNTAVDLDREDQVVELIPQSDRPLVALAFKLEEGRFGQLTYLRVYQGRMKRDGTMVNSRTGDHHRVGRLARMHADKMEEITEAGPGDIVAVFGVSCRSGDTFTDGSFRLGMTSIHVPDPVISLSVRPADARSEANLIKALRRFCKEDPTFRSEVDRESGETVISGMGELHLDVYLERARREYGAVITTSPPQVAYRETLTRAVEFDYTHRKQTGGAGQYGRVCGRIEPLSEGDFEFADRVVGGAIPRQFIPAVMKGFKEMLAEGPCMRAPVVQVRVVLEDGDFHPVDSKEIAFREAARGAWRRAVPEAGPRILEPIMRLSVETPPEFAGGVLATLHQRRGIIIGIQDESGQNRIEAEVPLAEMFGYSTVLRSATEGKATFSMEPCRYAPVPDEIAERLVAENRTGRRGRTRT